MYFNSIHLLVIILLTILPVTVFSQDTTLTVTADGNVGIGITEPSAKLVVISGDAGVIIQHSAAGGESAHALEVGERGSVIPGKPNGRIGFPGFDASHGQIRWVPGNSVFEFINSSRASPSGDYGDNPSFVSIKVLNVMNTSSRELKRNINALSSEDAIQTLHSWLRFHFNIKQKQTMRRILVSSPKMYQISLQHLTVRA